MDLLYDTNILIEAVRQDISNRKKFWDRANPKSVSEFISIVTVAEARSFAITAKWGVKRKLELEELLQGITVINIDSRIVDTYVEIDTFSQDAHPKYKLNGSHKSMGKNDIWIAATASVLSLQLITTDKDFDHLDNFFLVVDRIGSDDKGIILLD